MSNYLYYDYQTNNVCSIKENHIEYLKYPNVQSYLNKKCLENGSNFEGRKESFRYITNQKKFTPIVISLHPLLIFFPTDSNKSDQCKWINYCQIHSIQYKEKECTIYFKDHTFLTCFHPKRIENSTFQIKRFLFNTNSLTNTMNNLDYNAPFHSEEY